MSELVRRERRVNGGRNRYVTDDTPITSANVDQLVELWRATGLGASVNEPVVLNDDVYVTTAAGTVSDLSASTGEVRYTRTVTSPEDGLPVAFASPIYHGGEVVAGWNGSRSSATSRPGGVARLVPGTGELVEPLVPGFYWGVDSAEDGGGLATQAELVDLSPGVANGESYVDWRGIRASIGIQFGGFTFTRFALVGDHLVWQAGSTALGWNNQACTQPATSASMARPTAVPTGGRACRASSRAPRRSGRTRWSTAWRRLPTRSRCSMPPRAPSASPGPSRTA